MERLNLNVEQHKVLEIVGLSEFTPKTAFAVGNKLEEEGYYAYGYPDKAEKRAKKILAGLFARGYVVRIDDYNYVRKTENFVQDLEEYLSVYIDKALDLHSQKEEEACWDYAYHVFSILKEMCDGSFKLGRFRLGVLVGYHYIEKGRCFSTLFCQTALDLIFLFEEYLLCNPRLMTAVLFLCYQIRHQEENSLALEAVEKKIGSKASLLGHSGDPYAFLKRVKGLAPEKLKGCFPAGVCARINDALLEWDISCDDDTGLQALPRP